MRRIILDRADRLQRIPEDFGSMDRLAARVDAKATPIIDLSIIDCTVPSAVTFPDLPAQEVLTPPDRSDYQGFAQVIAGLYHERLGITLDPDREVLPLAGSAVGLFLLGLAYVDPGDMVLLPDPCPPIYRSAAALCGAGIQTHLLHDRHHYLPDTRAIEDTLVGKTKLWILGYPQNPSTALADRDAVTEIVNLGRKHNILIAFDNSFSFLVDPHTGDHGLLGHPRARSTGVEILSLDDTFGLGALHLAAVVGNREAIAGITNLAGGAGLLPGRAALRLGTEMVRRSQEILAARRTSFTEARAILQRAFDRVGWQARGVDGVPYCWVTIPRRFSSLGFARRLLRRTGIKIAPGTIFGERGEGYVRISILQDTKAMHSVADKLESFGRMRTRRGSSADQ